MEKVLYTVVTDDAKRSTSSVQQQVETEASAGAFWFD